MKGNPKPKARLYSTEAAAKRRARALRAQHPDRQFRAMPSTDWRRPFKWCVYLVEGSQAFGMKLVACA